MCGGEDSALCPQLGGIMKKLAGLLAACLFVSSIGLAGIAFADDTSVVVGDKLEFAPGSNQSLWTTA